MPLHLSLITATNNLAKFIMKSLKLLILFCVSLATFGLFIAPTEVVAQAILPISRGGTGNSSYIVGSIPFFVGTKLAEDNANFFWDNINKRFGIGTSLPTSTLSVSGNTSISGNLDVTGNIIGNITATNLVPYTGAT